jgi:hypothetical protein
MEHPAPLVDRLHIFLASLQFFYPYDWHCTASRHRCNFYATPDEQSNHRYNLAVLLLGEAKKIGSDILV